MTKIIVIGWIQTLTILVMIVTILLMQQDIMQLQSNFDKQLKFDQLVINTFHYQQSEINKK